MGDAKAMIEIMGDLRREAIVDRIARSHKMGSERNLGRAHAPDMESRICATWDNAKRFCETAAGFIVRTMPITASVITKPALSKSLSQKRDRNSQVRGCARGVHGYGDGP